MPYYRLIISTHQHGVRTNIFTDERDLSERLDDRVSARLVSIDDLIEERGLNNQFDDEDDLAEIECKRAKLKAEIASQAHGDIVWEVSTEHENSYYVEHSSTLDICKAMVALIDNWNTWAIISLDDDASLVEAYDNAPPHNFALWRAALRGDLPSGYLDAEKIEIWRDGDAVLARRGSVYRFHNGRNEPIYGRSANDLLERDAMGIIPSVALWALNNQEL